MANFYWTAAEFDRSEQDLMRAAFKAVMDNNSRERFRLLAIIEAKQAGGPRDNPRPADSRAPEPPKPPTWIGRFVQCEDGIFRIEPGSEKCPPGSPLT